MKENSIFRERMEEFVFFWHPASPMVRNEDELFKIRDELDMRTKGNFDPEKTIWFLLAPLIMKIPFLNVHKNLVAFLKK